MKKLIAITSAGISYLFVTASVFAQTGVNPCPTNSNQFFKLCSLEASSIGRVINTAVVVILVAAVLIALFFLLWGAIRWILSGGDKAKVETARSTIIAAIVGLIIAFLAYFILQIVLSIFGLDLAQLQLPVLTQ